MYEITITAEFSSAHLLKDYQGSCARLHGHNWVVELVCRSDGVDELGMVIDFRALKKALKEVLDTLDHNFLNDLDPFKEKNPSSENIARHIWEEVSSRLPADKAVTLVNVKVWESEDSWAQYSSS